MQHRSLVSSQPPRPGATAVRRLAQRGEPDIVLSREREQIACNVRVAQVLRHDDHSRLSSGAGSLADSHSRYELATAESTPAGTMPETLRRARCRSGGRNRAYAAQCGTQPSLAAEVCGMRTRPTYVDQALRAGSN